MPLVTENTSSGRADSGAATSIGVSLTSNTVRGSVPGGRVFCLPGWLANSFFWAAAAAGCAPTLFAAAAGATAGFEAFGFAPPPQPGSITTTANSTAHRAAVMAEAPNLKSEIRNKSQWEKFQSSKPDFRDDLKRGDSR